MALRAHDMDPQLGRVSMGRVARTSVGDGGRTCGSQVGWWVDWTLELGEQRSFEDFCRGAGTLFLGPPHLLAGPRVRALRIFGI